MIAAAFAFLRSPLGKYGAITLAVALALWSIHHAGYSAGVKHEQAQYAKALAKAEKKAAETKKTSDAITAKVEVAHIQTVEKIRTVTQTLIKEVPYAVPSDPARKSLSVGFVRLHDAAATGDPGLSDPTGRADAEASGVTDPDLSRVILANYETCRINAETVIAWQSWATDQAALYAKNYGAQR
jgi:hypothetical protein